MKQPKMIETLAFCDLLTNETKVDTELDFKVD